MEGSGWSTLRASSVLCPVLAFSQCPSIVFAAGCFGVSLVLLCFFLVLRC